MAETGSIEPLLDCVYDAAVDRDRWPVVLAQLAAHFGSGPAHFSFENVEPTPGKMIYFGADPAFTAHYGEYYVTRSGHCSVPPRRLELSRLQADFEA